MNEKKNPLTKKKLIFSMKKIWLFKLKLFESMPFKSMTTRNNFFKVVEYEVDIAKFNYAKRNENYKFSEESWVRILQISKEILTNNFFLVINKFENQY